MYLKSVTKVAQGLVLEGPMPAKDLAVKIGKPYSTMLREVNPFDTSAKLGVETLLDLMKATGQTDPLEYMAKEMGFSLVPRAEAMTKPARTGLEAHA